MIDAKSNFLVLSLFVAMSCLFLAPAALATDDDYKVWCQAKFSDFFLGEFKDTSVDPVDNSVLLKKLPERNLYCQSGEFVSPAFEAEEEFNAIFLSWIDRCHSGDSIRLFVRAGDEQGKYDPWTEVKKESELTFERSHKFIQYRVVMESESQTTSPELSSIAIYYAKVSEEMMNLRPQTTVYPFAATQPEIVERDAWGALKPAGNYSSQVPDMIILHHSWLPSVAQYKGAATIRGIQNYHMNDPNTGWTDIGYHFLIGPDGLIFRGRPENAVGSHCIPNGRKIGICCIGNFDPGQDPLPEKMYEALKKLVPYLASKHGISPAALLGHRDFSTKTCPGDMVYGKVPELRSLLQAALKGKK